MSQQPKSTLLNLECSICGVLHDDRVPQTICTTCGRVLLARYDLAAAKRTFSRESLAGRSATMWRYWEVMPIRSCDSVVSLGEGMTPLLLTERLAKSVGIQQLFVKDEGVNPTGSFKARGLAAATSKAVELGIRKIALPTAGNAGGAAAAYGARAGIDVHVAMPMDAPQAMMNEVRSYGGELDLVDGLISDAGKRVASPVQRLRLVRRRDPQGAVSRRRQEDPGLRAVGAVRRRAARRASSIRSAAAPAWSACAKAFDELEAMGLIDSRAPAHVRGPGDGLRADRARVRRR